MRVRVFRRLLAPLLVSVFVFTAVPAHAGPVGDLRSVQAHRVASIEAALRRAPLSFIENRGQIRGDAAFYVQGSTTSLYFTPRGLTVGLTGGSTGPGATAARRWLVRASFVGANRNVSVSGVNRASTLVSYFRGPSSNWKTGLRTYSTLVYRDLWPGIDLEYSGSVDHLKYQFVVHPGADPGLIRLAYRGASSVRITPSGQISVATPVGGFTDDTPYAYQWSDGRRVPVGSSYARLGGRSRFGFHLGAYDPSRTLTLDPAVLVYAGFVGGDGEDVGFRVAVDSTGAAYITGETGSTEATFPAMVGPDLSYNGGNLDAFIAKVKPDGSGLVYAGYIGGSGTDSGLSVTVDDAGAAYVTGSTASTEATFPVTVGPDLTYNGGTYDAFVAKVSPDGTHLEYCGYIGGNGEDQGMRIDLDSSNNAYVGGFTASHQSTFPVKVGPDTTYNGGSLDGFVAEVTADGTGLVYAGYIGGKGSDRVRGIAVEPSGAAVISGYTSSNESSFPVTVGPDLTYNGGQNDGFVAEVASGGTGFVYAGYIGGSGNDMARGIAVDSSGAAYVSGGITDSDQTTFPVTVGPDLTYNGGKYDAWVAKVSPDGTRLEYCGYIGGSGAEEARMVSVDAQGHAYVVGWTTSDQTTFPVVGGPDLTFNGGHDAFIVVVKADGTGLNIAGYIGGTKTDEGLGVAIDASGDAYVSGVTNSKQSSFPVTVGPDLTYNGGTYDAFVAKVAIT